MTTPEIPVRDHRVQPMVFLPLEDDDDALRLVCGEHDFAWDISLPPDILAEIRQHVAAHG